jgi:hypothetical protein
VRGLSKLLSDQKIFQLVLRYHSDVILPEKMGHPTSSRLIREFFKKDAQDVDLLADITEESKDLDLYGMKDWEEMLKVLDNLHFHDKMANFPEFMRVSLTYSGPSRMKGGEWISIVERRVGKIEERKSPIMSHDTWDILLPECFM